MNDEQEIHYSYEDGLEKIRPSRPPEKYQLIWIKLHNYFTHSTANVFYKKQSPKP